MKSLWRIGFLCSLLALPIFASSTEFLVRFKNDSKASQKAFIAAHGGRLELLTKESGFYKWTSSTPLEIAEIDDSQIAQVQKNRVITMPELPSITKNRAALFEYFQNHTLPDKAGFTDNPDIMDPPKETEGTDPMLGQAWGISKIKADAAWDKMEQGKDIVVAVIDTGVDYNHEDLIGNMWRNKGEIPNDGIDNDKNGFIDDVVGWDFFSNDNKPYDLSLPITDVLFSGGNPGHGTHVAGVIGARLNNSLGAAGVAPKVKIMAMRFLSEKGKGDTAGAVKAIDYAVANGANIINASWGSEGEEQGDAALREAIQRAMKKGVIFVAAAGNGRASGGAAAGYNNDTDAKPMYPSSYPYENIVSVAATNSEEGLAPFSNFGVKTVHVGAPGVKILSTTPGNKYQDVVVDLGILKVAWEGTSMAAPFVSGALAVIWSDHRNWSWNEVRSHLLSHTTSLGSLNGKVSSGGRIELK